MNGKDFVIRIDNLLKLNNSSRKELAEVLGVTVQTFVDWKRRNTFPPVDVSIKIADFLHTSVNYLATGKDLGLDSDLIQVLSQLQGLTEEQRAPILAIIKGQVEYWKNIKQG